MEELICSFCRQHPFLFIFLLGFFPPSLSPSLRQSCAVRLFQSSGVVRSDGWLSTFCCLPLRSWEIYRLADYQAWKPISPFSFFPPFLHPCHPHSFNLAASISTSPPLPKKASVMERRVQNNIEICAWTEESNCSSWGLLWMWQRGIASSEWCAWTLTAYLAHPHLFHCFRLLQKHIKIHPCSSWWRWFWNWKRWWTN